MADEKMVTLGQIREFAQKTDKRLDTLEEAVSFVRITIPVSVWVAATDEDAITAGFAYQADVAVTNLTENDHGMNTKPSSAMCFILKSSFSRWLKKRINRQPRSVSKLWNWHFWK